LQTNGPSHHKICFGHVEQAFMKRISLLWVGRGCLFLLFRKRQVKDVLRLKVNSTLNHVHSHEMTPSVIADLVRCPKGTY